MDRSHSPTVSIDDSEMTERVARSEVGEYESGIGNDIVEIVSSDGKSFHVKAFYLQAASWVTLLTNNVVHIVKEELTVQNDLQGHGRRCRHNGPAARDD